MRGDSARFEVISKENRLHTFSVAFGWYIRDIVDENQGSDTRSSWDAADARSQKGH